MIASFALALAGSAAGCRVEFNGGGFEEESAGEDPGEPPDLPKPECDVRRNDQCEAGFKCSYVEAEGPELGTNRCVPVLGEGLVGEDCELIEDSDTCAAQHVCWGADKDGLGGHCVSYCSVGLDCDAPEEVCSVSNYDTLFLCLQRCDPVLQDCALPGWGCYPDSNDRWSCDRDRSDESGAHGEPCFCLNCCDPGLVCRPGTQVDSEECGSIVEEGVSPAEGCCAAVCDVEDEQTLPEEQCPTEAERCRDYYRSDSVLMGYEHVGICKI